MLSFDQPKTHMCIIPAHDSPRLTHTRRQNTRTNYNQSVIDE